MERPVTLDLAERLGADRRLGRETPVIAPAALVAVALLLLPPRLGVGWTGATRGGLAAANSPGGPVRADAAVANFTAAMQRLVGLVGAAGGAILALVWARVALSWFSNDVTKKVQAKDRAATPSSGR